MTESEWLEWTDPYPMWEFHLRKSTPLTVRLLNALRGRELQPNRKALLACCAFCRKYWQLIGWDKRREAIAIVEGFVDEKPVSEFRDAAAFTVQTTLGCVLYGEYESVQRKSCYMDAEELAPARAALEACNKCFCDLVRDIFGNPFRPVTIQPVWFTPTVTNLATVAYEERILPSGELDTVRLAVVADALEEAGCTNAEILGHLRSPSVHVRGCWGLDLLLRKE
jgi:hypothetical protein